MKKLDDMAAQLTAHTGIKVYVMELAEPAGRDRSGRAFIINEHGTEIDFDQFSNRYIRPSGVVCLVFDQEDLKLYELSERASEKWRKHFSANTSFGEMFDGLLQ